MKLLTISTLFPNSKEAKHGIFVETRLKHLVQKYPDIEHTVIAPVPWFPFESSLFPQYSKYAKVPAKEIRNGITVYHPRYLVIPKVGMTLTPHTLAFAIERQLNLLINEGQRFDLIDGHYYYPDGVAIEKVAKKFNLPFTVTARGTDINLIPAFEKPKHQIIKVMNNADHNLAVCEALRQEMISIGAVEQSVTTLRNGVDLSLFSFHNEDQQLELRKKLDLPVGVPVLMSVGFLIERKGHHLIINTLVDHPTAYLVIAGSGPDLNKLQQLASDLKVATRVIFVGSLSQADLSNYYGAADALILASSREGWANVLLEAMASGTPVVATNVWGTPEVVTTPVAGVLVDRNSASISAGISQVLNLDYSRLQTRQYAENFNWDDTSDGQYQLFSKIIHS
ncbi:glycosyltransferase family 4 protein [Aliivibrio kagoshimensis]|uniref:glycosyltransferase family 4 protein n=1 Tax=Aliivibrio kagoshimensis TaxID=2910230 RepID=UPI003D104893